MNTLQRHTSHERGSAGLKAVIAIGIVGAMIFVGLQLIPMFWAHWNLEDAVKSQVLFASAKIREDTDDKLKAEFIRQLEDMGAIYEKKNVQVEVRGNKIYVKIWYAMSHKLPFYPNPKPFYIEHESTPI